MDSKMKDKEFGNILRFVFNRIEEKKKAGIQPEGMRQECPSEETIFLYLESGLNKKERGLIEKHLSMCRFCKNIIDIAGEYEVTEKESKYLKEYIKGKIQTFIEPIKISLAWVEGHLRLLETDADYIPFWNSIKPVVLRDDSEGIASLVPPLSKSTKEYTVSLEIIEKEDKTCDIHCHILPLAKKKIKGKIRADICEADRFSSYPFKENQVIIPNISPGHYDIKIYEVQPKSEIKDIMTFPIDIKGD